MWNLVRWLINIQKEINLGYTGQDREGVEQKVGQNVWDLGRNDKGVGAKRTGISFGTKRPRVKREG